MKFIIFFLLYNVYAMASALPQNFVYLHEIAPDISEDMRYAGPNNFTGVPIPGYLAPRCILTRPAAEKLRQAQALVKKQGYRIKVYDCYRPQQAVDAFNEWSKNLQDISTKSRYYPHEEKNQLFAKGYIALASGHSRGSTVDLTLVKIQPDSTNNHSIDMGTHFDYFDKSAHTFYRGINQVQLHNRLLLRSLMIDCGFVPYNKEWWHFTLRNEAYPHTYFNFPVQ